MAILHKFSFLLQKTCIFRIWKSFYKTLQIVFYTYLTRLFVTVSPCTLVLFFDFSFPFTTFLYFMYLLDLFFCQAIFGEKTNLMPISFAKIDFETSRHILVCYISLSYHCKRKKYFLWNVVQRMLCSVVLKIPRYYHEQLHEHATGIHDINLMSKTFIPNKLLTFVRNSSCFPIDLIPIYLKVSLSSWHRAFPLICSPAI